MAARPMLGLAVLTLLAACAGGPKSPGDEWVATDKAETSVDSALYWCSSTRRVNPGPGIRSTPEAQLRQKNVNEECMRSRGFKKKGE
jgi:hypothetical protein